MSKVGVGTFTVNDSMRTRVQRVLDTGRISYGPQSRELERRFAKMHECRAAVLSNSGTSSLQVALQALKERHGWSDGDEVLVPSVTFVATANVVLHNRLRPVLVDVDPRYFGMQAELARRAITNRTRAMIPVHLFGQSCNMEALCDVATENDLSVIEDSCETMFVNHRGRSVGSWGDVGCFSMYVAHLLTAGVGGIGTTNDPDLAVRMRSLVNHGRDGIYISIDDDDGLEGQQLQEVIERRFKFETVGHSFRITELEAALALGQLDDVDGMLERRRENAAYLSDGLRLLGQTGKLRLPSVRPENEHAWMMYPILSLVADKWELCGHLERAGVETREMLRLSDQPVYDGLWNTEDYPVAQFVNARGFYVGCHQDLSRSDLDLVIDSLYEYFRKIG